MRLRKANANDKIDDLAKAAKARANKMIDKAHDVGSIAAIKARRGVRNVGEKVKHTGERIETAGEQIAGAGERVADTGVKIMKLAD
jgi:hypothetical protein